MKCGGCGEDLVKAPTRCSSCRGRIAPGAPYRLVRVRGVCEPQHVNCQTKQVQLL